MSESALQDIQRSLNAIRNTVSAEDARTQMAALQLLLSASESIVQLARKMDDGEGKTKTRTRTIAIPQTKAVKQPLPQQQASNNGESGEREESKKRDTAAVQPQSPLTPQQQREQ